MRPRLVLTLGIAPTTFIARLFPLALRVVVDGFTRLGGSQYVNSVHNGDYETYVIRDVIGLVDSTYRTLADEGGARSWRQVDRMPIGRVEGMGIVPLVHPSMPNRRHRAIAKDAQYEAGLIRGVPDAAGQYRRSVEKVR